jgi:hypothetical protein
MLDRLAETMLQQSEKGKAKYGMSIDENTNQSPEYWLQHAMEEACDMAVYAQKFIECVEKLENVTPTINNSNLSGNMAIIQQDKTIPFTQSGTMNLLKKSILNSKK